ncbi:MAG: NAD(P)H-binding protein [Candidatus Acidiferrales bacterium]
MSGEKRDVKVGSTTYLITGATGDIGSRVVEQLLERGDRPRVFVRDAEKARARYGDRVDIFAGDLADASSLRLALCGVDTLFLLNSGPELAQRDDAAAKAARAAGVKHLVKLSSMDSQRDVGTGVWHARGESAIRASGIAYTFVQPAGFISNALGWATSIKAEGVVRAPTGDGRIAFIHPADIAAVATAVLTAREYDGEPLPITGPEALNYAEMTAKIGAATKKPIRFEPISEEQERAQMMASGDPAEIVSAHISIYRAIREGRLAGVTNNVERVIGRKPITFDQWAQENAAAFR